MLVTLRRAPLEIEPPREDRPADPEPRGGPAGRVPTAFIGLLPRGAPLLARSSLRCSRPCPLTSPRRGPARHAGRGRRRPAGPRRPPGAAPGPCPARTPSAPPPWPARTTAAARRG